MGSSTTLLSNPRFLRVALTVLLAFNAVGVLWLYSLNNPISDGLETLRHAGQDGSHTSHLSLPNELTTGSGDKIAMLIETRMLDSLIPLLLHYSTVLGPSWQVVLFTLESVWHMPASPPFQRAVRDGRIKIQFLPPETNLTKWKDVSYFLTRTWIWEQVAAASRVLLFQMDSIICSKSTLTVDDFLEWDFIGAPVNPFLGGLGYNGGLSLRNPKLILDILNGPNNNFEELWRTNESDHFAEDRFYYTHMRDLPHARLPDPDVARRFSVETTWYEWPVGYHAPKLWNADQMDIIWKYCPEVELIVREEKKLFVDLTEENG